jgi:hypothetical protein
MGPKIFGFGELWSLKKTIKDPSVVFQKIAHAMFYLKAQKFCKNVDSWIFKELKCEI